MQLGSDAGVEAVAALLARLREEGGLPRLIAFDLDYTLWSGYCEFHEPPFSSSSSLPSSSSSSSLSSSSSTSSSCSSTLPSVAYDRHGGSVSLYSDVRALLHTLRKEVEKGDLALAVVSRTPTPDHATQLLTTLGMMDTFHHHQIYPGSKKTHFNRILKQTRLAFKDMLFFDDEKRNVREVGGMGVTAILVKEGLTLESFSREHKDK